MYTVYLIYYTCVPLLMNVLEDTMMPCVISIASHFTPIVSQTDLYHRTKCCLENIGHCLDTRQDATGIDWPVYS